MLPSMALNCHDCCTSQIGNACSALVGVQDYGTKRTTGATELEIEIGMTELKH